VHCTIGKASFEVSALKENLQALMADLQKAKPPAAKVFSQAGHAVLDHGPAWPWIIRRFDSFVRARHGRVSRRVLASIEDRRRAARP